MRLRSIALPAGLLVLIVLALTSQGAVSQAAQPQPAAIHLLADTFVPAAGDPLSNLEVAELLDRQASIRILDDNAIHPGVGKQYPAAFFDLEIFRNNGRPVILFWCSAGLPDRFEPNRRAVGEDGQLKIRRSIRRKRKCHFDVLLAATLPPVTPSAPGTRV